MARDNTSPTWYPSDDVLRPFLDGINTFCKEFVAHPSVTADDLEGIEAKSIVDPVVGYVRLRPAEVALIDTLLFQRLRGIRQLGLAFQVYPTLNYSRFEHTLGVMGRLAQVLSHLRDHSESNIADAIDKHESALRLAALFHDVGHCIYSHVTERVIARLVGNKSYPSAATIRASFDKLLGTIKPIAMAEVFSLAILGNSETATFLSNAPFRGTKKELRAAIEEAGYFIAGLPLPRQPETLFLAQLMSSGLDADKLDYLARESHFAGVRFDYDLARLIDRMRIYPCTLSELPRGYDALKDRFKPDQPFLVLGLARGGQFAFEEFCIARVSAYEKIYLHQKVRAAEAQLANRLKQLPAHVPEFAEAHRWLYLKESLIDHPELQFPTAPEPGPLFGLSAPRAEVLKLHTIASRNLVHRAYAFGRCNSLSDPVRGREQPTSAGTDPSTEFIKEVEDNPERFITEVKRYATTIASILNIKWEEPEVIVEPARYGSVQQGQQTIHLDRPPRLPARWTMPIDQIVEYYRDNRALAYMYAPRHSCPVMSLAAERVTWDWKKVVFEQDGAVAKRLIEEAAKLKRMLTEKDYYQDAKPLLPVSGYLLSGAAQELISRVCQSLRNFRSFANDYVSVSSVTAFLMQFPEELQPAMLQLLLHFQMIDEQELASTVKQELGSLPGMNVSVCPLGGVSDSASHLMYHMREVQDIRPNIQLRLFDEFAVTHAERLVLFDDNVNSGLQVLNIFATWLGENLPDDVNLHEEHGLALPETLRDKLRSMPITFVFSVGTEGAEKRIGDLLETYLKIDRGGLQIRIKRVLREDEKLLSGNRSPFQHARRVELRDFLAKIGERLMISEDKSATVATARCLGDRGAEALIAFPYNTPSMTITALWCRPQPDAQEWMPLVERRRRRGPDGSFAGEDS